MDITSAHRQFLLNAARASITSALRGQGPVPIAPSSDPVLNMPAGCFVTLHDRNTHRLRGCIGRLQTSDPLIKSIHETAVSALEDPRFRSNPITTDELPRLEIEISILSPLKEAANPLDFDPPNDGIYLICQGRAGTFLPQVARETGWTREQLLTRLCTEKMGLVPNAWQDPAAKLLKYKVVVIGPEPFIKPGTAATTTPTQTPPAGTFWFGANNVFRV